MCSKCILASLNWNSLQLLSHCDSWISLPRTIKLWGLLPLWVRGFQPDEFPFLVQGKDHSAQGASRMKVGGMVNSSDTVMYGELIGIVGAFVLKSPNLFQIYNIPLFSTLDTYISQLGLLVLKLYYTCSTKQTNQEAAAISYRLYQLMCWSFSRLILPSKSLLWRNGN